MSQLSNENIPPVIRLPPVLPVAQGAPQPVPVRQGPWDAWTTLALTLAIFSGYSIGQAVAVAVTLALRGGKLPNLLALESDGLLLGVATLAGAVPAVGLSLWLAALRKTMPVREYLGLVWPQTRQVAGWIAVQLAFVGISDGLTVWLGRPLVPEEMVEAYRHCGFLPLFWLALLVAAPLAEEFLFRGFLLVGLAHSRLGRTGAILLAAVPWAALHVQYDLYGVVSIYCAGVLLGWARLKSGSLWLCIVMHATMNLIAMLEIQFLMP